MKIHRTEKIIAVLVLGLALFASALTAVYSQEAPPCLSLYFEYTKPDGTQDFYGFPSVRPGISDQQTIEVQAGTQARNIQASAGCAAFRLRVELEYPYQHFVYFGDNDPVPSPLTSDVLVEGRDGAVVAKYQDDRGYTIYLGPVLRPTSPPTPPPQQLASLRVEAQVDGQNTSGNFIEPWRVVTPDKTESQREVPFPASGYKDGYIADGRAWSVLASSDKIFPSTNATFDHIEIWRGRDLMLRSQSEQRELSFIPNTNDQITVKYFYATLATPTPIPTPTFSPSPSTSKTPTPKVTPTSTPIPTSTITPIPTSTLTPTSTPTITPSPTKTPTSTPRATLTPGPDSPSPTPTSTPTTTLSHTPTVTPPLPQQEARLRVTAQVDGQNRQTTFANNWHVVTPGKIESHNTVPWPSDSGYQSGYIADGRAWQTIASDLAFPNTQARFDHIEIFRGNNLMIIGSRGSSYLSFIPRSGDEMTVTYIYVTQKTPTPSLTPTPPVTPTLTPTPTIIITPTPTVTITPAPTATATPISTPTNTPTFTSTPIVSPTPTITTTPTTSTTPITTPASTPTPTVTTTVTPSPTSTPLPTSRPIAALQVKARIGEQEQAGTYLTPWRVVTPNKIASEQVVPGPLAQGYESGYTADGRAWQTSAPADITFPGTYAPYSHLEVYSNERLLITGPHGVRELPFIPGETDQVRVVFVYASAPIGTSSPTPDITSITCPNGDSRPCGGQNGLCLGIQRCVNGQWSSSCNYTASNNTVCDPDRRVCTQNGLCLNGICQGATANPVCYRCTGLTCEGGQTIGSLNEWGCSLNCDISTSLFPTQTPDLTSTPIPTIIPPTPTPVPTPIITIPSTPTPSSTIPPGVDSIDFGKDFPRGGVCPLIRNLSIWLLYTAILLSILAYVYGGFTYLRSGGEDSKVKLAITILKWTTIGLVLALIAGVLPISIAQLLGVVPGHCGIL